MNALAVSVEVHLANGLPKLIIVGLPDTEVREAKHRVQAALFDRHIIRFCAGLLIFK